MQRVNERYTLLKAFIYQFPKIVEIFFPNIFLSQFLDYRILDVHTCTQVCYIH
jgi:hypothetical protein